MRRLWLAVFATFFCGSVYALNFTQIGGSSGGAGGGLTSVSPSDLTGENLAPGQVPQAAADGGDTFDALTVTTTFYFEQSRETPRFVQSATNNPFVVDAATNPAYGLMAFSHSASSETNCGYFPMPAVRDYNTGVDMRLDEFRVLNGTGTDSGDQIYVVAVSSKIAGQTWLTATYGSAATITLSSSLGTVSKEERSYATADTLTGWKDIVASGVPWAVKVCRDGDAAGDTSTVDSRFSMLTIRAGNTVP